MQASKINARLNVELLTKHLLIATWLANKNKNTTQCYEAAPSPRKEWDSCQFKFWDGIVMGGSVHEELCYLKARWPYCLQFTRRLFCQSPQEKAAWKQGYECIIGNYCHNK